MARKLIVEIVGDASALEKSYRSAERGTKRFGQTMDRAGRGAVVASVGFKGLGRSVAFASGAFLGGAGFAAAVKVGFDETLKGQAVAADTAAALKSTGRVAGVTARQIDQLGTSLQRLTGYDDEAIRSAENLMLTFTNVRNVAGKGNDIFNQATKSTLDLSRRFGQDLSSSAVQLGKALQDPIRGVTALRRVGVSFTASQLKLITRLVNTGHLLEAQKVLLREVRVETGGAAAAYGKTLAGQLDILQGNLTNLAGELATTLNPEVKKLTERFNKWLEDPKNKQKVIEGFTGAMHGLGEAAKFAADTVGFLKKAWDKLPDFGKHKGLLEILGLRGGGGGSLSEPPGLRGAIGAPSRGPAGPRGPVRPGAARPGTTGTGRPTGAANKAAARRNSWFDAMIGRELVDVQDIAGLKGQIARLREISAQVTARLAITKDITRKLTLEDQVKQIAREIRGDKAEIAAAVKERAEDLAAAAKAAKEAARRAREDAAEAAKAAAETAAELRRQATEERMGWLDFAVERAGATKTIRDDVSALRRKEAFLQSLIASEGRSLALVRELWETRDQIRQLNKSKVGTDPLAGLMQVSSSKLTNILAAGTGLSGAGRRVLGANIAGAEIRPIHVHVEIDKREIGRAVTGQQARDSHRTASQTSGLRGG